MMHMKKTYISYDSNSGYPIGEYLFWECTRCGGIVPSMPPNSTHCWCDNIAIDVDCGRIGFDDESKVRLFTMTKEWWDVFKKQSPNNLCLISKHHEFIAVKCPFEVGDWVAYKPSFSYRAPFDTPLEVNKPYKVSATREFHEEKYLAVEQNACPDLFTVWHEFQCLPDFYLAKCDEDGRKTTHECRLAKRVKTHDHDDWMLIAVDPPVYGFHQHAVDALMIRPQNKEKPLPPIKTYPTPVHVALVTVSPVKLTDMVKENEYKLMPLVVSEAYKTQDDANSALGITAEAPYPKPPTYWYWKLKGY